MNYQQAQQQITQAEGAIERVKAGYTPKSGEPRPGLAELQERRKKIKAQVGTVLLFDDYDTDRRKKLAAELGEVDADIKIINDEVASLETLIANHRQYLSEGAKLERKRAAVNAGEHVKTRMTVEVPKAADALQKWLDDGAKLFGQLDEIASANSHDFGELARVAHENDDRDDAANELAWMMRRELGLNIDVVLAAWMSRLARFARNDFVVVHRPTEAAPTAFELLEHHADTLLAKLAELRAKIEQAQQEEVSA